MTAAPRGPSPAAAVLRLSLAHLVVIGLSAGVAFALIEGWRSSGRVLFLGVAAFVSMVVATVTTGENVRRTAVLFRARERLRRERVPPSPSALRDALKAPFRLAAATALTGVFLSVFELLSGGRLSGEPGTTLWGAAYAWVGMSLLMWTPLTFFTRGVMHSWLRPYDPRGLSRVPAESLSARIAADLVFTLLGLLVAGAAVYVSETAEGHPLPTWSPFVLGGAATVFAVLFAFFVYRARRLDRAVRLLADLVRTHRPGTLFSVASSDVPALADALKRLETRYATLARRETTSRNDLERSQRDKTMMMARLTHDLRSPLNAILGFSDLLLMNTDGALHPAQAENVTRIVRAGRELLALLDDVLDAAKYDAGRLVLHRAWTPSVEILTEAVARGRALAEGKPKLEITAELEPGLPPLFVDSARIVQAIVGLFRHSVRAVDEGRIHLSARVGSPNQGRGTVVVTVTDTSSGIREADRDRVFEAFTDVVQSSGRRIGGLGVGLALSRNLVCAHGGDVRCEAAGKAGTQFTVLVPVEAPLGGTSTPAPRG